MLYSCTCMAAVGVKGLMSIYLRVNHCYEWCVWHCGNAVCRYPNIACELLTSDVMEITDALVGCDTLFDSLLNFLDNERPLNPLQASFYGKLVALLISRKGELVRRSMRTCWHFVIRFLFEVQMFYYQRRPWNNETIWRGATRVAIDHP